MNKSVSEAVKEVATELLKQWDPETSDFIMLRDFYSVSYPVPLSKELVEKIRKYSPKRVENRVEVGLPIYEILHGAQWSGENLQVGEATVVFLYIDEETTEEILNGVVQNFAPEKEELE